MIDAGGIIHLVAGGGFSPNGSPEGPALPTNLPNAQRLIATPDGGVLFVGQQILGAPTAIMEVKNGHYTRVAAGNGCNPGLFCGEGGPARAAGFSVGAPISDLTLGQEGEILVAGGGDIKRIRPVNPLRGQDTLQIASDDGSQVYIFDFNGKHLETVDATTATVLYAMGYDANNRLATITDRDGLVTTIDRAADGTPTQIVGPYGQTTGFTLGSDGYLSRITDPATNHWDMTYVDGLMTSITNRNGHAGTMAYDPDGKLIHDANSLGGFIDLARVDNANGWKVTTTTALGRVNTYDFANAVSNAQGITLTAPDATVATHQRDPNGTTTSTLPDGMLVTTVQTADPRFGMTAPVSTRTERTPSGVTRVTQDSRSVVLSDILDPLSVTSRTDTTKLNGRSWTRVYNVATDVETLTSPAGRVTTQKFDPLGHLIEMDVPGVLPVTFGYDPNGRLTTTTQGTRVTQETYGADGWLATVTDPIHQTTGLTRDAVGGVLTEQRPDLAITTFGYDAEGNTVEVIPPGKPAHTFAFDANEQLASYDPPVLASGATNTGYGYNVDKQPLSVTQPGPRIIDYQYDSQGRPSTTTFPTGVITRTYDAAGRVASLAGPTGVTLSYGYDGSLLKTITWSGAVNGVVARTFDSDFRVANETVNGLFPVAFGYDADSLLASADGFSITRDPTNGRAIATLAGNVAEVRGYDAFGAIAGMSTSVSGSPLLAFSYVRDDLGRIVEKTETEGGVATVFDYDYDQAGRLINVMTNGALSESYSYDLNGNRTFSQNSAGTFDAVFDEQDRIETYGSLTFTYGPNGELASRTDTSSGQMTTFTYDAIGNLREVVLGDDTDIQYLVDGGGQRVGKIVDGVFERGWLWRDDLQAAAELDAGGVVAKRFVYAEGVNVPDLMVTSTATYRLVRDQLGTVRQVVDEATGAVVQQLAYDAWGRVLVDTNPGFQPFGFAGGLYDPSTGLVRFGARDYSAETGRWGTKDPMLTRELTINRYGYSDGRPEDRTDPTGEYAVDAECVQECLLYCPAQRWLTSLTPRWLGGGEPLRSCDEACSEKCRVTHEPPDPNPPIWIPPPDPYFFPTCPTFPDNFDPNDPWGMPPRWGPPEKPVREL